MSEVWLALDKRLGRRVALKLHAGYLDAARFEREARSAASLSHPNIAGIYDYGEFDCQPYLVLEYLNGGTLERRLACGKPLRPAEVERVARDIAAGLAHAHARGIVHRDLKPSNVLFDEDGRAKLADFGIALATHDGTMADTEAIFGTPEYMSPEQAAGEQGRPVSDVYSFGVILFRMLTGDLPFRADVGQALLDPLLRDAPPTVRSRRSDAPEAFALLADAALTKDVSARPANGAALLSILSARAPAPSQSSAQSAVIALPSRWRRGLVVVLSLLVAGAGGLALGLTLPHKTDNPRSDAPAAPSRTKVETSRGRSNSNDAPASSAPTGGAASRSASRRASRQRRTHRSVRRDRRRVPARATCTRACPA